MSWQSFGRKDGNMGAKKQGSITNYFSVSRVPQTQLKKQLDPEPQDKKAEGQPLFFAVNDVSAKDLMKSGGRATAIVNDKEVALICHNNVVYAVQEKCPHYGGPLHLGDIEDIPGCGPHIKCPWHKWTFSLETGKCIAPQNRDLAGSLETYPVQMEANGSAIRIGFNEISPRIFATPPE